MLNMFDNSTENYGSVKRVLPNVAKCAAAAVAVVSCCLGVTAMSQAAHAFQTAPSAIFDVNSDGTPDTIESVTTPSPAVRLLSGVDGAVLLTLTGQAGEAFGSATRTLADITGDGHPELLVYANAGTSPSAGAVYLFDVRTGLQRWRLGVADTTLAWSGVTGPVALDLQSGFSVITDQTEDGVPDVIMGAHASPTTGSQSDVTVIVDGRTGARLATRIMSFDATVSVVSGLSPGRIFRPTDLDDSGMVDTDDLLLYINASMSDLPGVDLNGDGVLSTADTLLMIRDLTDRAMVAMTGSSYTSPSGGGLGSIGSGGGGGGGTNSIGSYTTGYSFLSISPGGLILSNNSSAGMTFNGQLPARDDCDLLVNAPNYSQSAPSGPASILMSGLPYFDVIRAGPLQQDEDYWFRIHEAQADILRTGGTWPGSGGGTIPGAVSESGEVLSWTFGAHFYDTTVSSNANTRTPVRVIPSPEWEVINDPESLEYLTSARLRRPTWMNYPQSENQLPGLVRVQLTVVVQPPTPQGGVQPAPVTLCYMYDYVVNPECTSLAVERLNTFGRDNVCPDVFTPGQAIVVRAAVLGTTASASSTSLLEWNVTYATLSGMVCETARTSGTGVLRLNPPANTGIIEVWVRNRASGVCDPSASAKFTLTASVDGDADGVPDACEMNTAQPSGSTRFCTNPSVPDSDGDGFLDGVELALGSDPCNAASVPSALGDTDGDGLSDYDEVIVHHTNPLLFDTDGDGASDFAEEELRRWQLIGEDAFTFAPALRGIHLFNPLDPRSIDGITLDGFTSAYRAFDNDRDQLFDPWEEMVGLDPNIRDQDGDGWPDGYWINWGGGAGVLRLPTSGMLPPAMSDTDRDGLPDDVEGALGTDPLERDSDGDGLGDGFEVVRDLDPTAIDSDDDGTNDGQEDRDGDGLDELSEYAHGTDPLRIDSDGDGRSDGWEAAHRRDPMDPADWNTPVGALPEGMMEIEIGIGAGSFNQVPISGDPPSYADGYHGDASYELTLETSHRIIRVATNGYSLVGGTGTAAQVSASCAVRRFVVPVHAKLPVQIARTGVNQKFQLLFDRYRNGVPTMNPLDFIWRMAPGDSSTFSYQAWIRWIDGNGVPLLDSSHALFPHANGGQVNGLSRIFSSHDPALTIAALYTPTISIRDLRDWAPIQREDGKMTTTRKDFDDGFQSGFDNERELAGVAADGASPCIIRLNYGTERPGLEDRVRIEDGLRLGSLLRQSATPLSTFAKENSFGGHFYRMFRALSHGEFITGLTDTDFSTGFTVPHFGDRYAALAAPLTGFSEPATATRFADGNQFDSTLFVYLYLPPEGYVARAFNQTINTYPGRLRWGLEETDWSGNDRQQHNAVHEGGHDAGPFTAFKLYATRGASPGERYNLGTTPEIWMQPSAASEANRRGARDWMIVRPPVVLVHGIFGFATRGSGSGRTYYWDNRIWSTGPLPMSIVNNGETTGLESDDESYTPVFQQPVFTVNYERTNISGYDKALPALRSTIDTALAAYRSGGVAEFHQVPFRPSRIAVTKVDVVAHSMGGQIAKLYMSSVNSYPRPEGCDQFTSRSPSLKFERPANYNAGDVHRLVTIGTPHYGTTLAKFMWYAAAPIDPNYSDQLAEADRVNTWLSTNRAWWNPERFPKAQMLQMYRWPNLPSTADETSLPEDFDTVWKSMWRSAIAEVRSREEEADSLNNYYRAPNAIYDLSMYSGANLALDGPVYPSRESDDAPGVGPTRVPWFPISTRVNCEYSGYESGIMGVAESALSWYTGYFDETTNSHSFVGIAQDRWSDEYHGQYWQWMNIRNYVFPRYDASGNLILPSYPAATHHLESDSVVNVWSQRACDPNAHQLDQAPINWDQPSTRFYEMASFSNIGHGVNAAGTRSCVRYRQADYRPIAWMALERLSMPATRPFWVTNRPIGGDF